MADIPTTAPIAIHRRNPPGRGFPSLELGASLTAISRLVGDAFSMAYVAPYTVLRRQPQVVPDDDLEGRDPTW
jgi:hypothetical protein